MAKKKVEPASEPQPVAAQPLANGRQLPVKKSGAVNKSALCQEALQALGMDAKGREVKEWIAKEYGYAEISDMNVASVKMKMKGGKGAVTAGKSRARSGGGTTEVIRRLGQLVNEYGAEAVREGWEVVSEILLMRG